jgi:hypothetical protein
MSKVAMLEKIGLVQFFKNRVKKNSDRFQNRSPEADYVGASNDRFGYGSVQFLVPLLKNWTRIFKIKHTF